MKYAVKRVIEPLLYEPGQVWLGQKPGTSCYKHERSLFDSREKAIAALWEKTTLPKGYKLVRVHNALQYRLDAMTRSREIVAADRDSWQTIARELLYCLAGGARSA